MLGEKTTRSSRTMENDMKEFSMKIEIIRLCAKCLEEQAPQKNDIFLNV